MWHGFLALALILGLHTLAALIFGSSRLRRTGGLVIAALALAGPVVAIHPGWRVILGFAAVLYFMRAIDLFRAARTLPWWKRIWFVFNVPHLYRMKRSTSSFEGGLIGLGSLFTGLTLLLFLGAWYGTAHLRGPAVFAVRWACGLLCAYTLLAGVDRLARAAWHAAGWECRPGMRFPFLSRSLAEFWGRRWNLEVSDWLRRNCFRPLARKRMPGAGLFAAFAASAAIHIFPTWIAVGATWGLLMGAFFLLQGALVLLERSLGVEAWPSPASHAWTTLGVALPAAPLLVEPLLTAFIAWPK